MTDVYATPILTARETARYLKMPESTLDAWLASAHDQPLVHAVHPAKRGWPRVPFVGVVEAHVLRALRDLGMSMSDIRRAADLVRQEFDDPYALARKRIATDGVALFVKIADDALIHARDHQVAIADVLADHLTYVDWDDAGNPQRLRLRDFPAGADVVIDPRFGRGSPVLAASKVRVEDIVSLWRTGEPITSVADEYGLTTELVEDVLRRAA
ncbi:DUF433 domain-containing protein [Marmoricola sp. RAF53]|uniref:DUF433 domain-containing protein n=1 Tax=Marmoricola sp. RAF53 TaxID=3233059 RepID=UPI003F985B47